LTAELENIREEFIQMSNELQRLRECKFHTDLFDFCPVIFTSKIFRGVI
jgi:hypothetical protein